MPTVVKKSTLSGLRVDEALRKQVVRLHHEKSLEKVIEHLSKYKVNSVLAVDDDMQPAGVVSKTDIMGAYYALLPLESPLNYIMSSPALFCTKDDLLEAAMDNMRRNQVHSLYVIDESLEQVTGVLSYSDIVGLLYQYCHRCKLSKNRHVANNPTLDGIKRYKVKDVMSDQLLTLDENSTLNEVMETLSSYSFGTILLTSEGKPTGVVSKTDLVQAFKDGIPVDTSVQMIMTRNIVSCEENDFLEMAIQKMILAEVQCLFIFRNDPDNIIGVLSLSDTARLRSGSCHACLTSRIQVEKH